MVEYKYGELADWNDADIASRNEYMRLTQGDNRVRIFTLPYQFHVCWVKDASGANRKLRSALQNCPLIKRGEKVQTRWLLGVINRQTNSSGILEVGSQILNGLKQLLNEPDYGDPRGYDVNIKRGKPGDNPLYHVVAQVPKPLSDDDKALVQQFLDSTNLEKLTKPPTPEEVTQKMAEIDGIVQAPSDGGKDQSKSSGSNQASKPPIDEDTFNFDEDQL